MKHKHKIKLKNVFDSKGITLTETTMPRPLPEGWTSYNVSHPKHIKTPYVIMYGKVLIIQDEDAGRYIRHIAGLKL